MGDVYGGSRSADEVDLLGDHHQRIAVISDRAYKNAVLEEIHKEPTGRDKDIECNKPTKGLRVQDEESVHLRADETDRAVGVYFQRTDGQRGSLEGLTGLTPGSHIEVITITRGTRLLLSNGQHSSSAGSMGGRRKKEEGKKRRTPFVSFHSWRMRQMQGKRDIRPKLAVIFCSNQRPPRWELPEVSGENPSSLTHRVDSISESRVSDS